MKVALFHSVMIIIRSECKCREECLMLVHIVTGLTGKR